MNNFEVSKEGFVSDNIPWYGNMFLHGNGYLGVRGTLEEYKKEQMPAINMSGIYDRVENLWRESVNAPNPFYTYAVVDGKKYALLEEKCSFHVQTLDFYHGIHKRKTEWNTVNGTVTIKSERFASMFNQHVLCMKYSISTNFDGRVELYTGIDGDVWDINGPHFATMHFEEDDDVLKVTGITGEKSIAVTTCDYTVLNFCHERTAIKNDNKILNKISFNSKKGEIYEFEKISLIYSSVDDNPCNDDIKNLSYDIQKSKHMTAWEKIWNISKVDIYGDEEAQYALNYSIYHLNCIAPRNLNGKSIPARGLSGQVYKGAVFWDTEMFMIDYYIYTEPAIAKTLLNYRISTLDGARHKASEYGLEGAYYAWESQEGGYEGCSCYNIVDVFTKRPMRTYFRDKQYHVSAAVVYAFVKYINATGDYTVLKEGGLETIIECARMYRSLLTKYVDSNKYEIHDVVGPDEYHERVNNNAYTNRMSKMCFEKAVEFIDYAMNKFPDCYEKLDVKYGLLELKEVFKDSAKNIYIKEPDERGLIEQFDGYFKREDTTVDIVRSRILHPKEYWGGAYGVAAETQIIKQADVAAMLSIFKNDYSKEIMRRNWEYYEPRTEHGSSLSACMYSLLACHTQNAEAAYPLFMKSAKADLSSGGKEWIGLIYIGGTHPASEGGSWIVAISGFAGLEIVNGKPVCNPVLPKHWKGMKFRVLVCDKLYTIDITNENQKITEEDF